MADSTNVQPRQRRLVLGCVLLLLSVLPWAVAPFAPLLGLTGVQLVSVIAALLIGGEIIGAAAIAVLGREGYARITGHFRRSRNRTLRCSDFSNSDTHVKEVQSE